jgi:hypothetical protein
MVSQKKQQFFWEVNGGIMGWQHYKMQYEIFICRYNCMSKQMLCLLLMFHILYVTNTTKSEFVKRKYLDGLMQTLK